jgi:polypeptide N-acetylgalactosaminyltransferase
VVWSRPKVIGARHATGEVIVFLESHVEVNTQWVEPLLQRLKDKPRAIVRPPRGSPAAPRAHPCTP